LLMIILSKVENPQTTPQSLKLDINLVVPFSSNPMIGRSNDISSTFSGTFRES
jgi:hypothetical protein